MMPQVRRFKVNKKFLPLGDLNIVREDNIYIDNCNMRQI